MAHQLTYEMLVGSSQGNQVRVLIEVVGSPGDFSRFGTFTRHDIVSGLVVDVARSAAAFGVTLAPTEDTLERAITRF